MSMQATKEVRQAFIAPKNFNQLKRRIKTEYVSLSKRPIDDEVLQDRADEFLRKYTNSHDISVYIPRDTVDMCSWTPLKVLNFMFVSQEISYVRKEVRHRPISYELSDTIALNLGPKNETTEEKLIRWRHRPTRLPILDSDKFSGNVDPVATACDEDSNVRYATVTVSEPKAASNQLIKGFNKMIRASPQNAPKPDWQLGSVFWKTNSISSMRSAALNLSTDRFPIGKEESLDRDSWSNKYLISGRNHLRYGWVE